VRKDTVFPPHDLTFLLIKIKKITKLNFYQFNIKTKSTKIILEGKKPLRKNIVAIDNVL
jgi:hypothetical protein